jgi:16S rRNA (cytosine967-C5)-methyltransferase
LLHGVFGTLVRSDAALPDVPAIPIDTAERWAKNWGADVVLAAGRALAAAPPLDLIIKDTATTQNWAQRLEGISLMPGHVRLPRGQAVQNLPGYGDGAWWVQDISASLPARLLGDGLGRRALDLCAAPGGKTMQLAAAGWDVTAVDQSAKRMERVAENLSRTRLVADRIVANALNWESDARFDAILIDAPCSATGIFRRHPDVLHRVTRDMVAVQSGIQAQLLARAALWAKPGGVMIYATCSLEPEEGEAQIAAFLAKNADWMIEPIMQSELRSGFAPADDGVLRILPGTIFDEVDAPSGGADGFFIARLRHKA